ncbi:hypothetical protein HQ865_08505 [Mucilaginibacter mali]|uniref:Uncharacterized protein n=1 Tax=Mucilaginibacter mali TaxID=2740462 RepID=A0A7D4UF38_9SPHI|nr:hypothetical protein [Mucilaginibacter mali]QKJ29796.1 hypothetical protein HQ865_08505 [Mucilaginibacter mali]
MILTYYQAVELMTILPVLLSPADTTNTTSVEEEEAANDEDTSGIIEMWTMPTTPAIEVNGADFY